MAYRPCCGKNTRPAQHISSVPSWNLVVSDFKNRAQLIQPCVLRCADGEDFFNARVQQKLAGTKLIGCGGVCFGNHPDDAAVEHGCKGRRHLAGGTGGILHKSEDITVCRSGDERGVKTAVFQKFAGRIYKVAVEIQRKNLAGYITRIEQRPDKGTFAGTPFSDKHDFFHGVYAVCGQVRVMSTEA